MKLRVWDWTITIISNGGGYSFGNAGVTFAHKFLSTTTF
jgi:hypothetical protein